MTAAERRPSGLAFDGDEPTYHSLYEEYVRGFDEIPVLEDVVRIPPRRAAAPSFVQGERRSLRKEERPDGYTLREQSIAELESLYGEYAAPETLTAKRKPARGKKKKGRGGKRRKAKNAA